MPLGLIRGSATRSRRRAERAAVALAIALAFPLPAFAATVTFRAALQGANMVPPTESAASGYVRATYDTQSRELAWTGDYSGLSSKITQIAFHGPASPAATAGVVQRVRRLSAGSTKLSDAEAAELVGGYWNITIHTRSHPAGEIRGQLVRGE